MSKEDPGRMKGVARDREEIRKIMTVEKCNSHKMRTQDLLLTDTSQGGFKCPPPPDSEAAVKCVKPGLSQIWAGGGALKPAGDPTLTVARPRLSGGVRGKTIP